MYILSKYTALLGQKKLKEDFVKELSLILSKSDGYQIVPGKLTFVYFSELKDWSVRDMGDQGKLSEEDEALINKVTHMLFDINCDFESVIRMLYSFRNGPKSGIKVADPDDNYE